MTSTSGIGWLRSSAALLAAASLVATTLATASALPAAAADGLPSPPPLLQRDQNVVTSDPIPTVQIEQGYVWAQATIGSTVYAVGKFDNARAPLASPGTSLTQRSNVLAYDINSGELLPFAPTVNGVVRAVAASPDGARIYIGGSFTSVNGQTRYSIAALDAVTGQLASAFTPSVGGSGVYALTVSGSTVYAGGLFTQANGSQRTNLTAFNASNGALLPWAPVTNLQVDAMVMDPLGEKVIVGGRFSEVNGNTAMRGIAAVDKTTGAVDADWALPQTVKNGMGSGSNAGKAGIFGLNTDQSGVYGTGWVFANAATGNLEGTFAAEAGTGEVRWIADCLGDHYGVYSTGTTVYASSHTHACSTVGLHPEQSPRTHRFIEAYTADARGTLGRNPHTGSTYVNWEGTPGPSAYVWYPDFATGNTSGLGQAALSITGVGNTISVAGEFRAVNNLQFEGIVRFSTTPPGGAKDRPRLSGANWVPSAVSFAPGRARVSILSNWDRDDMNLTYELRRSGTSTPVATLSGESTWWKRPGVILEDTTATPGNQYTYTVVARDGNGNTATSQAVTVTIADGDSSGYVNAVLADNPQLYYPMGDTPQDWAGANTPVLGSGVSAATPGIEKSLTGYSAFSGTSNGRVSSSSTVAAPEEFSTELWFRTTTNTGGKLIGYGSSATGSSGSYDRHVYMANNGRLVFGVYPNAVRTVQSQNSYNNGQWHHMVATQSAQGIRLYVDGQLVGADASVTTAQSYLGYWRIGGDNLGSWPSAPSSTYFNGSIDEVAVYPYALTPTQVSNHHGVGRGYESPTAAFTPAVEDLTVTLDASASAAAGTASITSYSWDMGDGSPALSGQNASYTYSATGTYQVTLTVVDSNGLTSTVQQQISVLGPNQLPSAAFDVSAVGLTATADASESVDSDGTIVSYEWDWGDDSVSEGQVASHTYAAADTYTVTLKVTDDRSGVSTTTREVVATHADPVAQFSITAQALAVQVDGSASSASDGASLTYAWSWGDGTADGSGVTAGHTYAEAGTYQVTLTVTDSLGASHSTVEEVEVVAETYTALDSFSRVVSSGWGAAERGGVWSLVSGAASIASVSDGAGRLDLALGMTREMQLQATSVQDSETRMTYTMAGGPANGGTYAGVGSRRTSAGGYQSLAWHRNDGTIWLLLRRDGNLLVSQPLTGVTWSAGSKFQLATQVTGSAPTTIRMKLWADGAAEPANWQVTTTDSAAALQGSGAPTVFNYRAGSGAGFSPLLVDHFTVKDLGGGPAPNVPPVASFTSSVSGLSVSVNGSGSSDSDGSIASYAWTFGDGGTGSGVTASHPYAAAGTYTVTLTVTDDDGATHSTSRQVTVTAPQVPNVPPVASFTTSVTGLSVSVNGSGSSDSDGSIASYAWTFGDGGTGTGVSTSHAYGSAGTYTVTLTVTDDDGATHSTTRSVTVTSSPGPEEPEPGEPIAQDEFDRTATAGWGNATAGGAWTVIGGSASAASVSDGASRLNLAPGSTRFATLNATTVMNSLVETEFQVVPGAESGGSYVGVVARQSGNDRYQARVWLRPDGSVWLVINRGSTVIATQPLSGVTHSAETSYRLKVSVVGVQPTTISVKFWESGAAEPGWQLITTDAAAELQSGGAVGLTANRVSSAASAATISFESFLVSPQD